MGARRGRAVVSADLVRAGAAGFLLSVLLVDLSFDLPAAREGGAALDVAVTYYRTVVSPRSPLARGTLLTMLVLVATIALDAWRAPRGASLADGIALAPVAVALTRTLPSARAFARSDGAAARAGLVRSIARDHLTCAAAMLTYLAIVLAR